MRYLWLCAIGLHARSTDINIGAAGYNYVSPCKRCGR